jgi:hypothetical protein
MIPNAALVRCILQLKDGAVTTSTGTATAGAARPGERVANAIVIGEATPASEAGIAACWPGVKKGCMWGTTSP